MSLKLSRTAPTHQCAIILDSTKLAFLIYTLPYFALPLKTIAHSTLTELRQFLPLEIFYPTKALSCQVALSHASCRALPKRISPGRFRCPTLYLPQVTFPIPTYLAYLNCLQSTLHGPRPAGCQTGLTAVSGSARYGACFRGASANGYCSRSLRPFPPYATRLTFHGPYMPHHMLSHYPKLLRESKALDV